MAVTFRSAATYIDASGTSATATEPAGAASGDMLVALYSVDKGFSPALPAGWTLKFSEASASKFDVIVGYIARGGSAPSYAFTHTGTHYRFLRVICLQGAAAVTFDAASASGAKGTAQNTNPDPPAVVAVASSSLAICGGIHWAGSTAGGWTPPSGYTIRGDNGAGDDSFFATKSLSASGSEDPGVSANVTTSVNDDYWHGFTMTFTDAGGGTKAPPPRQRTWRRMERRAA